MRKVLIWASMTLVLMAASSSPASWARSRKQHRLARGTWGGTHVSLTVGESSATIEYDCAHGLIDGPLLTDRRGRFGP